MLAHILTHICGAVSPLGCLILKEDSDPLDPGRLVSEKRKSGQVLFILIKSVLSQGGPDSMQASLMGKVMIEWSFFNVLGKLDWEMISG